MSSEKSLSDFKILGIEHVGIALDNTETAEKVFQNVLGISQSATESITDQKVTTDIFDTGQGKVELLTAMSPDSPITKFLEKKGPGMHHLALRVDNISAALHTCKEAGIQLIDEKPRIGAEGLLIAFIHPKSTGGILLELCQKP